MYVRNTMIAAVALLGLSAGESASAFPVARLDNVTAPIVEKTFFYGGPRCFYPDGWHGPGYYRCGFRFRRGLGFLGVRHGFGGGGGFGGGRGFGGHGFGGGGHRGGFGGGHGGGFGGHGGGHGGGGHGGGGHGGGGHGGGHGGHH